MRNILKLRIQNNDDDSGSSSDSDSGSQCLIRGGWGNIFYWMVWSIVVVAVVAATVVTKYNNGTVSYYLD